MKILKIITAIRKINPFNFFSKATIILLILFAASAFLNYKQAQKIQEKKAQVQALQQSIQQLHKFYRLVQQQNKALQRQIKYLRKKEKEEAAGKKKIKQILKPKEGKENENITQKQSKAIINFYNSLFNQLQTQYKHPDK